jgi:hypothetical protein
MRKLALAIALLAFTFGAAGAGSDEVRLVSPPHDSMLPKGEPFIAVALQQVQSSAGQGAATLQFSNSPDGPWTTCQPDAGAVRANAVPWDARDAGFTVPAALYAKAWVRVGIWYGQGGGVPAGTPDLASDPVRWKLAPQSQPEPEAPRG